MSQLVLFGPAPSSYVRTARMVAAEKGLSVALEPIELGSAALRSLHPWSRVPVLRHGELTICETSAITRYLEDLGAGPSLLPKTAPARARMEQWISAINCYVYDSLVRTYALTYIRSAQRGAAPDAAQLAAAVPHLQRDVANLDAGYADGQWLAGAELSLADLFVAPIAQTISMFPEGQAALATAPNLARALAELQQRDSYAVAHAGLFGAPATQPRTTAIVAAT